MCAGEMHGTQLLEQIQEVLRYLHTYILTHKYLEKRDKNEIGIDKQEHR